MKNPKKQTVFKKSCPKCGYVRKKDEFAQEYECPKCGIIYTKYKPTKQNNEVTQPLAEQNNEVTQPLAGFTSKGITVQNFIVSITGISILLMLLFPPFHNIHSSGTYNAGYGFILTPPYDGRATVDIGILLTQVSIFLALGCIFYFLFRNSGKRFWSRKQHRKLTNYKNIIQKNDDQAMYSKTNNHPWRRLFARSIDLVFFSSLMVLFFVSVIGYLPLQALEFFSSATVYLEENGSAIVFGILIYLLWVPIESTFLTIWGTTPAKWLFGIYVLDSTGKTLLYSTAFKRTLSVVVEGDGAGIPPVAIFTRYFAYKRLKKTGTTLWDKLANSVIIHKEWGPIRTISCVLVAFASLALATVLRNL